MWLQPKHYKALGEYLGGVRKDAGVRQSDLARKLGKPQSFVSDYERGQRRIDVLEFVRIADALGVAPDVLFAEILRTAPRRRR